MEYELGARVTVPLNLVKGIIHAVQANIDAYEKAFGPLPEQPRGSEE